MNWGEMQSQDWLGWGLLYFFVALITVVMGQPNMSAASVVNPQMKSAKHPSMSNMMFNLHLL